MTPPRSRLSKFYTTYRDRLRELSRACKVIVNKPSWKGTTEGTVDTANERMNAVWTVRLKAVLQINSSSRSSRGVKIRPSTNELIPDRVDREKMLGFGGS